MSCFSRGYHVAREKADKGSKFFRSCTNCEYFGKERKISRSEKCLNDEVSQFDIIVDGNNVYCTLWSPYTKNLNENKIFGKRKTGRRVLDVWEDENNEEV